MALAYKIAERINDHFVLQADYLRVTYLPKGTQFYVEEYDGCEHIVLVKDKKVHTA